MSTDLPAHVGRQTDPETGYALVCNAETDTQGALCLKPATLHVRWREQDTENGFACDDHHAFARSFAPFDEHDTTNSACGMPGSWWILGDPSHCTMLALDDEPDREGHAVLTAHR